MAESNVVRFPTRRKRSYNPHCTPIVVAALPENVTALATAARPRSCAVAPDFPARHLMIALLSTLEPGHAARMFRHFEVARTEQPENDALADAHWWLSVAVLTKHQTPGKQ